MLPEPDQRAERLGWIFVALALPLMGLTKINPLDVAWHLATARQAEALGHWPIRNTFSWTFPDYTLYQQYPVFQGAIYGLYKLAGWPALSVVVFAGWSAVCALFVRASGPFARALPLHAFWALVIFSVQTRTTLRPDILSLSFIALTVILFDAYRERHRAAIALVPLVHLVWVNSHQFFVMSFALQGLFVAHLLLARWGRFGVDRRDAAVPIGPVLGALAASLALSFASPLGTEILRVFSHTSGSLAHHRHEVQELARVWSDPVWLAIGLVVVVPSAALLLRSWRAWSPFDVGLWLMAFVIGFSAIRGLVYATLVSGAVFQRTLLRQPIAWRPSPLLVRYFRGLAVLLSGALTFTVLYHRWLHAPAGPGGTQAGLGRSAGDWHDAALAALKPDPPPGRMLNMSWSSANDLIWSWPEQPVFVDPRFEAYPRPFLINALRSRTDDAVLARLIATHRPSWLFVEHCAWPERGRVANLVRGGAWQITYADVLTVVLVNRTPATEGYRTRHPFSPASAPPGLVATPPGRRVRQRICYAQLLAALGETDASRAQLTQADGEAAGDADLREILAKARQGVSSGTSAQ